MDLKFNCLRVPCSFGLRETTTLGGSSKQTHSQLKGGLRWISFAVASASIPFWEAHPARRPVLPPGPVCDAPLCFPQPGETRHGIGSKELVLSLPTMKLTQSRRWIPEMLQVSTTSHLETLGNCGKDRPGKTGAGGSQTPGHSAGNAAQTASGIYALSVYRPVPNTLPTPRLSVLSLQEKWHYCG